MALNSINNFWHEDSFEPIKPKEIPHEVTAEPITAWRIWRVDKPASLTLDASLANQLADAYDRGQNPFKGLFGARLNAVGVNAPWNSRVTEATCNAHGGLFATVTGGSASTVPTKHKSPDRHCSCGVWALKNEKDLWQVIRSYNKGQIAYGRVLLWGQWFEHKKGYRAQYAQPYDVNVIGADQQTVSDLRAFYGCDVRSVEMPKEVLELPHEEGGLYYTQIVRNPYQVGGLQQFISTSVTNYAAPPLLSSFKDAAAMFPGQFPILERAAENAKPAMNPTVEWLTDVKGINGRKAALKNYTQIFRTPCRQDDRTTLFQHLREIETKLEYGTPSVDMTQCVRTMGGFRHYLNRDLRKKDKLILRPLREPRLVSTNFGQSNEWISEVTLQVVPG